MLCTVGQRRAEEPGTVVTGRSDAVRPAREAQKKEAARELISMLMLTLDVNLVWSGLL